MSTSSATPRLATLALAFALALGGCKSGTRLPPQPTSVKTTENRAFTVEGPAVEVVITGENFTGRAYDDFGGSGGAYSDAAFTARLNDTTLRQVRLDASGNLLAVVPEGLPRKVYDLTVVDPWGNEGVLRGAFRVLAVEDLPNLLAGFRVAPVAPQQANTPFTLSVEAVDAQGIRLDWYNGAVELTDLTGTVVPASVGFFSGGVWTGAVEIRASHAADVLTVSAGGFAGHSEPFAVAAQAATAVRFVNARQAAVSRSCAGPMVLAAIDSAGFPTALPAAQAVALQSAPSDGFALFEDAACTRPLAAAQMAAGAGELRFFFRGERAGNVRIAADADGMQGDAQIVTVRAAAPTQLAFVSGAGQAVVAGACSDVVRVESRDPSDNAAVVSWDQPLTLAVVPAQDFAFYSDPGCTTALFGSPVIEAGTSTAQFWFSGTRAGVVSVTLTNAQLGAATTNETIAPDVPVALAFATAPQRVVAGDCSMPVRLQLRDRFGNPAGPAGAASLSLAAAPAPGLDLFAGPGCAGAPVSAAPLAAGQAEAQLSFRGDAEGAFTLSATFAGLAPAQQVETIDPRPPKVVAFVTPEQAIVAGECSGAVTLEARDTTGTPRPVGSAPVAITVAAAAGSGLKLSTTPSCAGAVDPSSFALAFAANASRATFYFTGTVAGAQALSAKVPGWDFAIQTEQVQPAAAVKVGLSPNPFLAHAGDCSSALAAALLDRFGNVAPAVVLTPITFSAAPALDFDFYADAGCSLTKINGVAIAAGADHTTFYFKSKRAGLYLVNASAPGLNPGTLTATVAAKNPDRLVFTTPPRQIVAGSCSAVLAVQAQDALGNPVAVFPAAALALSATGSNVTFYSDGSCATPLAAPMFAAGSDTVSFYARATAATSSATVKASAFGFDAVQAFTVDPGPTAQLVFDPISSPQAQYAPFAVTLRALDVYDNDTPAFTADALVSLLPLGAARCEANCRGVVRTGRFNSGVWSGALSVDTAGTARRLVATSGSALGTSGSFDVTAAPAQSAPRARVSASPGAVVAGSVTTLNASGSLDYQTAVGALQAAWDLSGAQAGAAPWTGTWSATAVASASWATAGLHRPRVAVRDAALQVGYGVGAVMVVSSASELCTVTTASLVDDGATSCGGAFGTDGALSLTEALRLANAGGGPTTITFQDNLRMEGATALAITQPLTLAGSAGTVLAVPLRIAASVTLLNLEVSGLATPLQVDAAGALRLVNVDVRDGAGLLVRGSAQLEQVRFRDCAADCVADESGTGLTLDEVEFLAGPAANGVRVETCGVGAPAVDIRAAVFAGLRTGVLARCDRALQVRHVTFANNQTGIAFAGGSGHRLQNCVFAGNSVASATCGTAVFAARDHALLWSNGTDACLAADPSGLQADPLFVYPSAHDFRLAAGSPALDSALDLALDVDGPAPGNYLASGPDRGGAEWY